MNLPINDAVHILIWSTLSQLHLYFHQISIGYHLQYPSIFLDITSETLLNPNWCTAQTDMLIFSFIHLIQNTTYRKCFMWVVVLDRNCVHKEKWMMKPDFSLIFNAALLCWSAADPHVETPTLTPLTPDHFALRKASACLYLPRSFTLVLYIVWNKKETHTHKGKGTGKWPVAGHWLNSTINWWEAHTTAGWHTTSTHWAAKIRAQSPWDKGKC